MRGEPVIVEAYGKPMAAILSYDEDEAYQQDKQARAARFSQLRAAANELSEAEALALLEQERQAWFDEQVV